MNKIIGYKPIVKTNIGLTGQDVQAIFSGQKLFIDFWLEWLYIQNNLIHNYWLGMKGFEPREKGLLKDEVKL